MLANHSEYIVDVLDGATEVEMTCKRGGRRYTTSGLKLTPLVRCKECYMCDEEMWCSFYDSIMESDDFCSYGERSE